MVSGRPLWAGPLYHIVMRSAGDHRIQVIVYSDMSEKPVIWVGDSRERIRAFPEDVRMIAGFSGESNADWNRTTGSQCRA